MVRPFAFRVKIALLSLAALGAFGCQPSIGDKCQLSTDCSTRGDRLCDTSQVDGYCTLFNCVSGACPDDATCVQFGSKIPGCAYDDRRPSRVGRTMCLATCTEDSDCRPGYLCRAPSDPAYGARIVDTDKTRKVCLVAPRVSSAPIAPADAGADAIASSAPPPVCAYSGPDVPAIDASAPKVDGGVGDAGVADAKSDAPADGGGD